MLVPFTALDLLLMYLDPILCSLLKVGDDGIVPQVNEPSPEILNANGTWQEETWSWKVRRIKYYQHESTKPISYFGMRNCYYLYARHSVVDIMLNLDQGIALLGQTVSQSNKPRTMVVKIKMGINPCMLPRAPWRKGRIQMWWMKTFPDIVTNQVATNKSFEATEKPQLKEHDYTWDNALGALLMQNTAIFIVPHIWLLSTPT